MDENLDLLEQRLLRLGQKELALETRIRDLQALAREAGRAGRFDESDAVWNLKEQSSAALTALLAEIRDVERVLYTARNRKR